MISAYPELKANGDCWGKLCIPANARSGIVAGLAGYPPCGAEDAPEVLRSLRRHPSIHGFTCEERTEHENR